MSSTAPRVEQFMTRLPHTIGAGASLTEAHALMRRYQIRHLPVIRQGSLVGVVSMHDLHLLETLGNVNQDEVPVEDAMTENPYVVTPDTHLEEAVGVLAHRKIGSAIVARGEEVVGVFTTIDALHALMHIWKNPP